MSNDVTTDGKINAGGSVRQSDKGWFVDGVNYLNPQFSKW